MPNRKLSSDTTLVRLFPEHPWREPVRLRVVEGPTEYIFMGCRFCLYRHGSYRTIRNGGLPRFPDAEGVLAHLAAAHP